MLQTIETTQLPDDVDDTTLLYLLSNSLILDHTAPYLSTSARLNLAATSRPFRELILHTPGVFRHLDLTQVKTAQFDIDGIDHGGEVWRNAQLDENVTEDDFYSGPLRGIFGNLRRRNILQDVQTLILDGLSVTAELVHEIILDQSFSVRILSIRGAKNLNERKLCGSLQYACRPSRPENMPRLKALYVFGPPEHNHAPGSVPASGRVDASHGAQIGAGWNKKSHQALSSSLRNEGDEWYEKRGRMVMRPLVEEWANALVDCQGVISFDAVPCTGPRHLNSPAHGKFQFFVASRQTHWAVATFSLAGCASCGSAPEGLTVHGETPLGCLPLLSPPPLLSSSLKSASTPQTSSPSSQHFVARCADCIRERYCGSCHRWWCEDCYQMPGSHRVSELVDTDVIVVDPEGSAWVQHQEADSPQPKVWNGICNDCTMGELIDAHQRMMRD